MWYEFEEVKVEVTLENALTTMQELQKEDDKELRHMKADIILLNMLRELGYNEVCDEFEKLDKYYI